jgi:hypothetical protein
LCLRSAYPCESRQCGNLVAAKRSGCKGHVGKAGVWCEGGGRLVGKPAREAQPTPNERLPPGETRTERRRTPAQLRSRARLSAASRKYSCSLTEKQRSACIATGAARRTRPRLYQSGPMTGQQYWISNEYALQEAHGDAITTAIAPQVLQPQRLKVTSWVLRCFRWDGRRIVTHRGACCHLRLPLPRVGARLSPAFRSAPCPAWVIKGRASGP